VGKKEKKRRTQTRKQKEPEFPGLWEGEAAEKESDTRGGKGKKNHENIKSPVAEAKRRIVKRKSEGI